MKTSLEAILTVTNSKPLNTEVSAEELRIALFEFRGEDFKITSFRFYLHEMIRAQIIERTTVKGIFIVAKHVTFPFAINDLQRVYRGDRIIRQGANLKDKISYEDKPEEDYMYQALELINAIGLDYIQGAIIQNAIQYHHTKKIKYMSRLLVFLNKVAFSNKELRGKVGYTVIFDPLVQSFLEYHKFPELICDIIVLSCKSKWFDLIKKLT